MPTAEETRDPWLEDVELDSWNDHEARSQDGGGDYADDELEYGAYQFVIVDRSPVFDDQFNPGRHNVNIKFVVVNSDDPDDIGKRISQWFKVSSHPMADLYALFKAGAGGHLDHNVRPKLSDLHMKQVRATWAPKTFQIDGKMHEKVKLGSFMPARTEYPVPAYRA